MPDEPRGPGRPPFVPTDEQRRLVDSAASVGLPHADIAKLVKIAENTLRKYFGDELEIASAKANLAVARTLFAMAIGGNVAAAIYWTKARMKWTERIEVTGIDGGAIEISLARREFESRIDGLSERQGQNGALRITNGSGAP